MQAKYYNIDELIYVVCLINHSSGTVHSYIESCGGYTPTTMLDVNFAVLITS